MVCAMISLAQTMHLVKRSHCMREPICWRGTCQIGHGILERGD